VKRLALRLVVADAGPLIGLARIGRLELLRHLFRHVLIPDSVAVELCMGSGLPGATALAAAKDKGWLKILPVTDVPAHLSAAVDRGEAEAIVLAKRKAAPLLIDESSGRTAARSEGVIVFGTGAVLIRAKEAGLILDVRHDMDALLQARYRMSNALRTKILQLAGEASSQ